MSARMYGRVPSIIFLAAMMSMLTACATLLPKLGIDPNSATTKKVEAAANEAAAAGISAETGLPEPVVEEAETLVEKL